MRASRNLLQSLISRNFKKMRPNHFKILNDISYFPNSLQKNNFLYFISNYDCKIFKEKSVQCLRFLKVDQCLRSLEVDPYNSYYMIWCTLVMLVSFIQFIVCFLKIAFGTQSDEPMMNYLLF